MVRGPASARIGQHPASESGAPDRPVRRRQPLAVPGGQTSGTPDVPALYSGDRYPWSSVTRGGRRDDTDDEIDVFPGPDEIEGFWALDKMHAPRPVTPLSFDLVVRTLAEGFTKAQAEYDCPIMVSTKEVNHYFYVAFHPIPDEAEIADG